MHTLEIFIKHRNNSLILSNPWFKSNTKISILLFGFLYIGGFSAWGMRNKSRKSLNTSLNCQIVKLFPYDRTTLTRLKNYIEDRFFCFPFTSHYWSLMAYYTIRISVPGPEQNDNSGSPHTMGDRITKYELGSLVFNGSNNDQYSK